MFCENCGKNIPDTATMCPHCRQSTGARPTLASRSAAPAAAPSPGNPAPKGGHSFVSRAEKAVYFRIARGFSWALLIIITIGLIVDMLVLVPEVLQAVWTSTSVSSKDLKRAVSSPSSVLATSDEGEADMNPAEMAQLDQVAYEIINLLPADSKPQAREQVDFLRGTIRNSAANLSKERKEQLAILRELRDNLGGIPEAQRSKAIETYFGLKSQVIARSSAKKEVAKAELLVSGSALLTGIVLLTVVTMILVLLSIERNTRPWQVPQPSAL
jgi:hypothetical protein